MRRLKRFMGLTTVERSLLFRALFVVGTARMALWSLPVAAARRLVAAAAGVMDPAYADKSVWAVKVASRYIPRATCLTQALAVQAMLARAGRDSRVEIGVAKEAGQFEAHAWVVCTDQILIGGPDVSRYSRLTTWASGNI